MIKTQVLEIGKEALSSDESLLIFFGETATSELRNVSIIQKVIVEDECFELEPGDSVTIDSSSYSIERVGKLATQQLKELGHITLFFGNDNPEDEIVSAVYLKSDTLPDLKVGTTITYSK